MLRFNLLLGLEQRQVFLVLSSDWGAKAVALFRSGYGLQARLTKLSLAVDWHL